MIVLACSILGALFGAFRAKKRQGRPADILQYAVVHAMIFAVMGLFITLLVHRALL
jgi:hypothetical protein